MRLARGIPSLLIVTLASFALIACGGDDDDGGNGNPGIGDVDPAGSDHQYVMSRVLLPTTATEANMYGLNLDGDPQNRPDNALGSILSALAGQSQDLDLQATIDSQVAEGSIIILSNIKATSLQTASGVGMWIYLGDNPGVDPCTDENDTVCGNHLEGGTTFDLHADSPRGENALLVGQIVGGKLTAGPGNVTIDISLVDGGDNLRLNLIGARAEIQSVSEDGLMTGKLGGAVTKQDLDNSVLPALHGIMVNVISEDCTGTSAPCCESGSTGQTLIDLFDKDPADCEITLDEVKNNSLIASLLAPDVDLLDCPSEDSAPSQCTFNPRTDGIEDSLSLGLGFSGVSASFTPVTGL